MYLGPIHSVLPGGVRGHDPVKPLKVSANTGKAVYMFDAERPVGQYSATPEYSVDTVFYEASQAAVLARISQAIELGQNMEWQRSGIFIQWREDGVTDSEDGWYYIKSVDINTDVVFSAYAEPTIDVELRARQTGQIGIYNDIKSVPNDFNLGGTAMAAYPMGTTAPYPVQTYSITGKNGTILLAENPTTTMRATVSNYVTLMAQGRCVVSDETSDGVTTVQEVFWRDHRNQNGYTRVMNDLMRYTLHPGDNGTQIDVWQGGAWLGLGAFTVQAYNGTSYTTLPMQTFGFDVISPEEVRWWELRYDAASTSLVRLQCRVRRGSKLVEVACVVASGLGLVGAQSIEFTGALNVAKTLAAAADSSGVVWTNGTDASVPGFTYLSKPAFAASTPLNTQLCSGITVASGTLGRFCIIAGSQDAVYTGVGTAALYAAKQASWSRSRIKQRILPV